MIHTKPKGTSVYSFIRTFVESECDFGKNLVWVQSLAVAHNGHASMQWPCWIMLNFWLLRLSVLALHHQFPLPLFPLPPFSLHTYTLLPFCDTDSKGWMGELLCVLTDEYWWFVLHDKRSLKRTVRNENEKPQTHLKQTDYTRLVILYHYIWHQTCLEVHDIDTDLSKP